MIAIEIEFIDFPKFANNFAKKSCMGVGVALMDMWRVMNLHDDDEYFTLKWI